MQRIAALNPETTEGKSKELFESVKKKLGMVPNLMRTMGNSPATLNGYLSFSNALSQSAIGGKLSELIALTVANENGCEYCTAAHTFIAANLLKVDHHAIAQAKKGKSSDNKTQLALNFSKELIETKGKVSDESIEALKDTGFTEGEITEIVAHTALNIFTNFINNSAQVKVDFPAVELKETAEV
jgi:uncharacterized peroxidase-related enzyme